jgi:hypothetical protein
MEDKPEPIIYPQGSPARDLAGGTGWVLGS